MIPLATIAATLALVTGHPTGYSCAGQPLAALGFTDAATWAVGGGLRDAQVKLSFGLLLDIAHGRYPIP